MQILFVKHLTAGPPCTYQHVNTPLNRSLLQKKPTFSCVTSTSSGTKRMQQRKGNRNKLRVTARRLRGRSPGQIAKRWTRTHKCASDCVCVCVYTCVFASTGYSQFKQNHRIIPPACRLPGFSWTIAGCLSWHSVKSLQREFREIPIHKAAIYGVWK